MSTPASYLLERAWVDGQVRDDVLVTIEAGRFVEVTTAAGHEKVHEAAQPVPGLTLPGLANCHSHAFHRALRGRTQRGSGTFWTWREQMYRVAERLDPDSYYRLARATYAEMVAAGITSVGEFHYLHHQPDGTPYADPNAIGLALVAAARDVGLRITLLDTCYLSSGFGAPVEGRQRRYSDGTVHAWRDRVAQLSSSLSGQDGVVLGAAIHSVRAVPAEAFATVVEAACGAPLHVHLSEQTKENDDCVAAYAATPTQLLADHGVLGPATTVVHATHLTSDDLHHLGSTTTRACLCPTTERDLGDGIGPARALQLAGASVTLGSDSQAVIDLFEEMRALELDERLAAQTRGHWTAAELLGAATEIGQQSLGYADAGRLAVGARADLVTIDLTAPSTAGTGADEHTAVFAATAADVSQVMIDGRIVATGADRARIGADLARVIDQIWSGS